MLHAGKVVLQASSSAASFSTNKLSYGKLRKSKCAKNDYSEPGFADIYPIFIFENIMKFKKLIIMKFKNPIGTHLARR